MDKRFDHWLFEAFRIDVRALALLRMLFAAYVLLFLGQEMDGFVGLPASAYHPAPGLASWLPVPLPGIAIDALEILILIGWVALGLGAWTVAASRGLAVLMLLYFAMGQSLGKIDHVMLMAFYPFIMSWSGWGNAWSVDARRGKIQGNVQAWPLAVLAMVIGFLWFSAACFKVAGGWLDPDHCAACWHHSQNILLNQPTITWSLSAFDNMEWMDWGAVIFEGLFLPVAFFPRLFRIWIVLAIGFHLLIQLTMGIDFTPYALAYMPFFSWGVFRWSGRTDRGPRLFWWPLLTLGLGLAFWEYGSLFLAVFGPAEAGRGGITLVILCGLALVLWVVGLGGYHCLGSGDRSELGK